jgi:sporulation-control protein spo0M
MVSKNLGNNTTVTLGFVVALLSAVGTSGYFVGTAHNRIDKIEADIILHRDDDRDTLKILLDIDRRLSRIEGRIGELQKKIP